MAGTFVFSADASLRITFSGGTGGDPIRMHDFFDADVAGGWDVVTNPYPDFYVVSGQLYADAAIASFVHFAGYETVYWPNLSDAGYTELRAFYTTDVCTLTIDRGGAFIGNTRRSTSARPRELRLSLGDGSANGAIFQGWLLVYTPHTITDCWSNCLYWYPGTGTTAIRCNTSMAQFVGVPGSDTRDNVYVTLRQDRSMQTLRGGEATSLLLVTSGVDNIGQLIWIDPAAWPPPGGVNLTAIEGTWCEIRYSLAPIVVNAKTGAPLAGQLVTFTDIHGDEQASWISGADGLPAAEQTVPYYRVERIGGEEVETSYGPYTITVSDTGYRSEIAVMEVDAPINGPLAVLPWLTAEGRLLHVH